MRLIWMSDIHLNFLNRELRSDFYNRIKEADGDIVIISGDIAESHNIKQFLKEICETTKKPVFFVCGNHDFYGSSITVVKRSFRPFSYLSRGWGTPLTDAVMLLGVDGWGDCRNGDYENSNLTMSDWLYIDELRESYRQGSQKLKKTLQSLADKDAQTLKRRVNSAIKKGYKKLILVTHVPPFEECCCHAGKKSTPDGLPFFSSKILGDTILPMAKLNPEVDFLWLSGHTHSRVTYKPCDNMTCKVAKADYYFPQIEEIINV